MFTVNINNNNIIFKLSWINMILGDNSKPKDLCQQHYLKCYQLCEHFLFWYILCVLLWIVSVGFNVKHIKCMCISITIVTKWIETSGKQVSAKDNQLPGYYLSYHWFGNSTSTYRLMRQECFLQQCQKCWS